MRSINCKKCSEVIMHKKIRKETYENLMEKIFRKNERKDIFVNNACFMLREKNIFYQGSREKRQDDEAHCECEKTFIEVNYGEVLFRKICKF